MSETKTAPVQARNMVLVGCKHPAGVVLNLDHYVRTNETTNDVRRAYGKMTVTLKGWSKPFNQPDNTAGGYALTEVPADFWDQWMQEHPDFSMIEDGTILPPHKDMKGNVRDHASIDRMFKPVSADAVAGVAKLTKDD